MSRRLYRRWASTAILTLLLFAVTASARTWTDASGLHKTDAEIASVANGVVTLRKPDGTLVKVGLDLLSEDDIKYVHQYVANALSRKDRPSKATPTDIAGQIAATNEFFEKLSDQFQAVAVQDTEVRISAAHEEIFHALDAEAHHITFVFRFPIRDVAGHKSYTLYLGPPDGIDGITGYTRTFRASMSPTEAEKLTTSWVLIVRGHGHLTYAPHPTYLYAKGGCVADVYVPQTHQSYGLYLDDYTWHTERGPERAVQPPSKDSPQPRDPAWPGQFAGAGPGFQQPQGQAGAAGQPAGQGVQPQIGTPQPQAVNPNGPAPGTFAWTPTPPAVNVQPQQNAQAPAAKTISNVTYPAGPIGFPTETQQSEPPPAPPVQQVDSRPMRIQHPIDLQLPSAQYIHSKLTPDKHYQRQAHCRPHLASTIASGGLGRAFGWAAGSTACFGMQPRSGPRIGRRRFSGIITMSSCQACWMRGWPTTPTLTMPTRDLRIPTRR